MTQPQLYKAGNKRKGIKGQADLSKYKNIK